MKSLVRKLILSFCLLVAVSAPAAQPKHSKKTAVDEQASAVPQLPADFVEARVEGVMDYQGSKAVILKDPASGIMLPIWIGDTEAFSIGLRLERQQFQRPLTHDLMDRLMRELGGELVRVQVDDLRNKIFLGTITVRQGKRVFSLDARPSDSIALAIGNQVPIYVARKVFEEAGIKPDEEAPQSPDKALPSPEEDDKTI